MTNERAVVIRLVDSPEQEMTYVALTTEGNLGFNDLCVAKAYLDEAIRKEIESHQDTGIQWA